MLLLCLSFLLGLVGRPSKPTPPWPETAVAANTKRGMVLPFEPHSITFDEITYSVDMPRVIILSYEKFEDNTSLIYHHNKS